MSEKEKKIKQILELLNITEDNKNDVFFKEYIPQLDSLTLLELDKEISLIEKENEEAPVAKGA